MKTRYRRRKSELLRAIERRLMLDDMEQAITAFVLYCRERQNRRTAAQLDRRGGL